MRSSSVTVPVRRGMRARIAKASYTRDTEFLHCGVDVDEAVEELRRLAAVDLGDYLEFRFVSTKTGALRAASGISSTWFCI